MSVGEFEVAESFAHCRYSCQISVPVVSLEVILPGVRVDVSLEET